MQQRNDFTHRLLTHALTSGMYVLDIGCGTGEVSFLANSILQNTGLVVGIDNNVNFINQANTKITHSQAAHVKFESISLDNVRQLDMKFDAIIGRRILMYLDNLEDILNQLKSLLKPHGKMVFQESDAIAMDYKQDLPLHEQVQRWIWQTVKNENGNIHIGSQLYQQMQNIDMEIVEYISENILQTPKTGSDLAWVATMMQERMAQQGVVDKQTLMVDTLEKRLKAEIEHNNTVFIRDTTFGIVAQKI